MQREALERQAEGVEDVEVDELHTVEKRLRARR